MSSASSMNFSWIEDGRVAGCRKPRTDSDLEFLTSQRIQTLIRLDYEEKTSMTQQRVEASGMADFYEPVKDFSAPSQDQIHRVLKFIRSALYQGNPVAVCCGYGKGRTGTLLACYLVSRGLTPEQAIERLGRTRPDSKEEISCCPVQKEAINEFARKFQRALVEDKATKEEQLNGH